MRSENAKIEIVYSQTARLAVLPLTFSFLSKWTLHLTLTARRSRTRPRRSSPVTAAIPRSTSASPKRSQSAVPVKRKIDPPKTKKTYFSKMSFTLRYIGATWCATCKVIKPKAEELCKKFSIAMDTFDLEELDEDEANVVTKVPTLLMTKDNKVVETWNQNQLKSLEEWLTKNISLKTEDF